MLPAAHLILAHKKASGGLFPPRKKQILPPAGTNGFDGFSGRALPGASRKTPPLRHSN